MQQILSYFITNPMNTKNHFRSAFVSCSELNFKKEMWSKMILLKGHAMGYLCTLKGSSLADECMIIEYDQSTWEFLKCCFEKKTIYINPMIMNFLFLFVLSLVVYTLMYGLFSSKNDDGRVVNIFLCKESIFVCDYLFP